MTFSLKHSLLTAVCIAACTLSASAAFNVPYTSELGSPYGIDTEWYNTRGNGSKAWLNITGEMSGEWGNTGCTNGVQYVFSETSAADAWLISPDITLEADKDYYLTIWVRTEFSPENFRVTVAQGDTPAAQRNGTVLIDMNNETVQGRWKRLRKSFRVDEGGNYNFGLNCYSKANQFTLYVTGFSLVEGDGTHAIEVIPAAEPKTMQLPYRSTFPDDCLYWSAIRGSATTGNASWYYEESDNSYAFIDPDEQEDNWLVSPGLEIAEAGDYKISVSAESYGVLDWYLGTDPADPSTFTMPLGGTSYPGTTGATLATINDPGTYYVGFHAHAENGSSMGYGVYYLNMRIVKDWPQPVSDLSTTVDPNGAMKVWLEWTNPSQTLKGNDLAALEKVEVYRDDVLVATLTDMLPGQKGTYIDTEVDQPGLHTYHILPYNELGASEEDARKVESMYVGTGVEEFPYEWTTGYDRENYEQLARWVAHNPDGESGREWHIEYGWRYSWNSSRIPGADNNDYVATPYIHLEKGYYKVTFEVNDRHANYDFGYVTDRADLPGTFVPAESFRMSEIWNNHENSAVIRIATEGDYAMAWHHVAGTAEYCGIEIYSIRMEKVNPLPTIATELTVEPAEDFSLSATLNWRNPGIDNAGYPLDELTRVIILRNSERIADLRDDIEPGAKMEFVDTDIPETGEYEYSVQVFNEHGAAQALPASVKVYIGKGAAIPYQADLQSWTRHNLDRDNYEWQNMENGGITFYSRFSISNDWAVSPYIYLEPSMEYDLTVTASTISEYDVEWDICSAPVSDPEAMTPVGTVTIPAGASADEYTFRLSTRNGAKDALPAGNRVFAAHATGMGTIRLHSFAITQAENDAIQVAGSYENEAIRIEGNMIILPAGTETTRVFDTQGRLIATFAGDVPVNADRIAEGIFFVEAYGAYGKARARFAR